MVSALEAVKRVRQDYGVSILKPCIAYLLDGNPTTFDLRKVAFTIAIELRHIGLTAEQAEEVLLTWAATSGFGTQDARRAVRSAFQKTSKEEWRYHPPGLKKRSPVYAEVLKPVCDEVGCPANCPASASKYQGPVTETFERFRDRGWVSWLRKRRKRAVIDVYEAICRRERQLKLAPGAELLTSYKQLALLADVHHTTAEDALRSLREYGLISFEAGSGSGPHARDRLPSRVMRVVPIPPAPGLSMGASKAGGQRRPYMGRPRRPREGDPRHYESWGGMTKSTRGIPTREGR